MPAIHRVVEVKLPEAEILADLYGIRFDLEAASYLCVKAVELGQPRPHDYLVVEGLVAAAVIRYGRCFSSGVRLGLHRQDLAALSPEALEAHNYFKALRDKFVAHSVNPFEETYVTASASERDGTRVPIQSVGPGQHRLELSTDTAEALSRLISAVEGVVHQKVVSEELRLLSVIQALPLDTIHSGDLHSPGRLQASDVHRVRQQKSRSNKALKGAPRKRGAP
jgi:hypothetical protein